MLDSIDNFSQPLPIKQPAGGPPGKRDTNTQDKIAKFQIKPRHKRI